jgi:polysaccharide biosynthesis protein VpsM
MPSDAGGAGQAPEERRFLSHDVKRTPRMHYRDFVSTRAALALVAVTSALVQTAPALAAANPTGPAVIEAGPVALTPTLGTEFKYRDNIYLQEHNTTDSWIYLARPALNALLQDRSNLYQLGYKGEAGWYDVNRANDRNDYFDNTFSGDAHLEFSDRWIAEGYTRWARLHEDRGTGLSEGLVGEVLPEPVEYDQGDVGGSLQYGTPGVGRLVVRGGYMDREYQNFQQVTQPRDRDETTLASTFFYPVAPNTDVLIEYEHKNIHYPTPFVALEPLDSEENYLLVGAQWEITPNLTSTAKAGYVDKNFDSSQRKDWDGVGWTLDLLMQPREQDAVLVSGSRKPEETTEQGDFIKSESLKVAWTHNWSDRVYTELGAIIGRDTYEQSFDDREDDIYNLSVRVGYEFRRWANVYMGYSHDNKDSNAENLSYTDNVFNIGIELSL